MLKALAFHQILNAARVRFQAGLNAMHVWSEVF